jgi:uncharacterized protein (TIGR04255 family)
MADVLPNAPLAEVVFELRWRTLNIAGLPFGVDPGYSQLFDSFARFARKAGFARTHQLQEPQYSGFAGSVSCRFHRDESTFPMLQIGPGVFAANESSGYQWETFRKRALEGAKQIRQGYPVLDQFGFEIIHIELRYIDAFEHSLMNTKDFSDFVRQATNIRLEPPAFWHSSGLRNLRGRIQLETDVKKLPGGIFTLDLATAARQSTPVIRMESKVVQKGDKLVKTKTPILFAKELERLLERAHTLTREAFKQTVSSAAFEKFRT